MRYVIIVSAAGLALMSAGPLAMSAVGASPFPLPPLPAVEESYAKPARAVTPAPAAALVAASADEAAAVAAVSLDDLLGGEEEAEIVGEGDAVMAEDAPGAGAGAPSLASRIRVALFRDGGCPGEQQSLVIIGAATHGWDVETAGSALRIVGDANDLCPAVSAALERSTIAAEAAQNNDAPLAPASAGAPGGSGGPGYGSNG